MPMRTSSDHRRAVLAVGVEHGQEVVVDPHPLPLAGVAPDEDGDASGQEDRPAERARDSRGAGPSATTCTRTRAGTMATTSRMPRRSVDRPGRRCWCSRPPAGGGARPGRRPGCRCRSPGSSRTKPIRIRVTSMPVAWARPPHTPASTRVSGLLRRGPREATVQPVARPRLAVTPTPAVPQRRCHATRRRRPGADVGPAGRLWVGRGRARSPPESVNSAIPMIARPGPGSHQGHP